MDSAEFIAITNGGWQTREYTFPSGCSGAASVVVQWGETETSDNFHTFSVNVPAS